MDLFRPNSHYMSKIQSISGPAAQYCSRLGLNGQFYLVTRFFYASIVHNANRPLSMNRREIREVKEDSGRFYFVCFVIASIWIKKITGLGQITDGMVPLDGSMAFPRFGFFYSTISPWHAGRLGEGMLFFPLYFLFDRRRGAMRCDWLHRRRGGVGCSHLCALVCIHVLACCGPLQAIAKSR